jgi:long-chain acyl-CoA synthetase
VDVSALLEIRPAPRAVLDHPNPDDVRFRVRNTDGSWRAVTYRDFAAQIRDVGAWLISQGVQPGDRCAIHAPNSVGWAAAALGIQAAGAVLVPIYPASTPAQVEYVMRHSQAKVLFRAADLEVDRRGRETLTLDARLAAIDLDATALMLYTSGTSGDPKGVPLTHRNVGVNAADWLRCNAPLLERGYRDLLWLPMSHIFGFGELCLGNTLGWESWLATPADALAVLPEVAPQVFMSVPAYWEKLARGGDLARATGGRLKFCLSGGAGLKMEIKQQLHAAGILVIEGYGLTETSPTLTLNRPDDFRFDTVGKPVPSVELKLAEDGEILARGPSVFRGYHDDPAATAAAFDDDGWFKTGDVGRWTDDGFLQIIDRKKEILVTAGGKNVPPANIEARFAGDPVIERCVVYGDAKPYLVAGVWLTPGADRDAVAARIAAINGELARFETIKKWWIAEEPLTVEGGTLTSSLKLRRKVVYERYRADFEALYA